MDFSAARENMIDCQIRTNKVTHPGILSAMSEVPRELFVPGPLQTRAYVDEDLILEGGRALMEPLVLARLLQEADPGPEEVALVVGAGTGYSVAILAQLCGTAVGIEKNKDMVKSASNVFSELGLDNAVMIAGDISKGYPKQAPYDLILIDGAVAEIPAKLCEQLTDGGRLVAVEKSEGVGRATVVLRRGNAFGRRGFCDVNIPFLPEFAPEETFVF